MIYYFFSVPMPCAMVQQVMLYSGFFFFFLHPSVTSSICTTLIHKFYTKNLLVFQCNFTISSIIVPVGFFSMSSHCFMKHFQMITVQESSPYSFPVKTHKCLVKKKRFWGKGKFKTKSGGLPLNEALNL